MTTEAEHPVIGEAGRAEPGRGPGRVEHGDVSAARTKAEPALMGAAVERSNMQRAYQRVVRNKGAAGVDGLGVSELGELLRQRWPMIETRLLAGSFRSPLRSCSSPCALRHLRPRTACPSFRRPPLPRARESCASSIIPAKRGDVAVTALDDSGAAFGPFTLSVEPGQSIEFSRLATARVDVARA